MIMVTMEYTICKAVDLMTAGTFLQPLVRPFSICRVVRYTAKLYKAHGQAKITQQKLNGRARSCGNYEITIICMSSN